MLRVALSWMALAWLAANATYVYLLGHESRAYRVESAALILVSVIALRLARRPTPWAGRDMQRREVVGALAAVTALWVWVVRFVPRLPFLSDDYVFLTWANVSGDIFNAQAYFRPLFSAVFLFLSRTAATALPFHLLGLSLHLASALLAYSLARRLFQRARPAVIVFAVFLLNPIQLEAVAWVSGLQDQLWVFFALSAIWAYSIDLSHVHARHALLASACSIAALLSKETGICSIAALALVDLYSGRLRQRSSWLALAAFGLIAVGYLFLRRHFSAFEPGYLFWPSQYFIKEMLVRPYAVFAQPWNFSAVAVPGVVRFSVAVGLGLVMVIAMTFRRLSLRVLAGPALVLCSTLPLYGYFHVGSDLFSSRYIYFGAVGWGLLIAELVSSVVHRHAGFVVALATVSIFSAVSLHVNGRPWRASGELVRNMATAVTTGRDVDAAVTEWRSRHPGAFQMKNGAPYTYDGVGIFINGFEDFRDRFASTAIAP